MGNIPGPTPFALYSMKEKKSFQAKHPDKDDKEIRNMLYDAWDAMSEEQKGPYASKVLHYLRCCATLLCVLALLRTASLCDTVRGTIGG